MTEDTIERTLSLAAPIERVWEALTDPRQLSLWFGTEAEVDLHPGGKAAFGWPGEGRFHAVVVEVDPPRRFAYRWAMDRETLVDAGASTLVTFTLHESDGGTTLHLVESGFASLPEDVRDRMLAGNTRGWREELAELAALFGVAATT
jgi:uncharacterized protein YndB with AHSA1/START domain